MCNEFVDCFFLNCRLYSRFSYFNLIDGKNTLALVYYYDVNHNLTRAVDRILGPGHRAITHGGIGLEWSNLFDLGIIPKRWACVIDV